MKDWFTIILYCTYINFLYFFITRILEVTHFKAVHNKDIWPYMVQELKPTLDELGIALPEELGYDKPELMLQNPFLDKV